MKELPIAPNKLNISTTKDYYTDKLNNNRSEFQLFNLYEDVLKKFLPCLNRIKTRGMNENPEKLLKEAADASSYPLSKIINLLVKLSIFPEEFKITQSKLILTDPKNYRPISPLPLVSRITEKSMHYQLKDYL